MVARHPLVLLIVGLVSAALAAVAILSLRSAPAPVAGVSGPTSPPPSSSPAPSPSDEATTADAGATPSTGATPPGPALDPDEAVTAATAALTAFIKQSQKALATPEAPDLGLDRYAAGAALEEVQAQAGEFVDLESRISGTSRIVSVDPVRVDVGSTPARVMVSACLDDAAVVLISPENPDGVSAGGRALNTYVIEWSGGLWKVVEHSYPDMADC